MDKRIIAPLAALVVLLLPAIAAAAPAEAASATAPIAKALAIGLAVLGGGYGQGKAVAAALEGICRNPSSSDKVFTPMLLGLAFIESLVIFALLIAFLIQ